MFNIVIVGAGFTGTMVAVQLARQARFPLHITLIERSGRFGRGIAYGTREDCHLLNVPAGRMSAYPEDEDHFLRWASHRDPSVRGGSFLPRRLYGAYLRHTLGAAETAAVNAKVSHLNAEAVAILPCDGGDGGDRTDRLAVRCSGGYVLEADAVVLASGNYPPGDPPCATPDFYASTLYRRDPWAQEALDLPRDAPVLLLGTGLTMIDVAMSLHARGHRGAIHAVSRRGLLPQVHRESLIASSNVPPPAGWERWPRSARGLLRSVRDAVDLGERDGVDWRDVMTSLRSITAALWASLPQYERRRFLRHLQPYWDTHRHRTAPAVDRIVRRMRDSGQLRVGAGRVLDYEIHDGLVHATVRARRGGERVLRVASVVNCTGPVTDLARVADPLVQSLRGAGMIRPDALGLGMDSDEDGRIIDARGEVQPRFFLAGPLRRGLLWEHIAVPELRVETRRLAAQILDGFAPRPDALDRRDGMHRSHN